MSAVATVPIGVANGTYSAPQYTFTSDSNTGLYRYSSDNLGITTGGAACAVFNSDGLSLWNGKKVKLYDTGSSHSVSHKAPALTANVEFTWPSDAGSNGQVLATNGSGTLSWQASVNDPPVGSIVMWPSATVPSGWLHCNGQSVNRNTYQDLFNVIGTTYGADDANHFDVPDMRGLFVRGWANGSTEDPGRVVRTDRGDGTTGDNVGTKQGDLVQAHTHTYVDQVNDGNGNYRWWKGGDNDCASADKQTAPTGGNESRPKNIAMMYIIRAT